jgi:hypothetical protein
MPGPRRPTIRKLLGGFGICRRSGDWLVFDRATIWLGIAANAFCDGYAGSVDCLNWNDFSDDKQCRTCLSPAALVYRRIKESGS